MKRFLICAMLGLSLCASMAQAKSCDDVKAAIVAKLESKGVRNYTLEVVKIDEDKPGRVVGQCDGGTRKIVYVRDAAK